MGRCFGSSAQQRIRRVRYDVAFGGRACRYTLGRYTLHL